MRGGKLGGQDRRQPLDGKALAGVVAGENQGEALCLGRQGGVEARLAGQEAIALGADGIAEHLARAAAGDGNFANVRLAFADDLQAVNPQESFDAFGEVHQRQRRRQLTAAAGAMRPTVGVFVADDQRLNVTRVPGPRPAAG